MKAFILFCLILMPLLSGCATNSMTGRSQLMIVSETAAVAKSANMYSAMISQYDEKGKLYQDQATLDRVHKITNRLVERAIEYRPETSRWEWQVNVIDDDDTVNAACMSGGKMVLFTGLLNKINPTDDELAQVMGHEISHALAKHSAEKMSVAAIGSAVVAVAAVAVAASDKSHSSQQRQQNIENTQKIAALGAMAFITLPNSRTTETEADRMGIELAARAGYDPAASITLWKKMMAESGQKSRRDFMSTHPSPLNRIDFLTKMQPPMQIMYEESKAIYSAPDYKPSQDFVQMNRWGNMTSTYDENDPEIAQLIHSGTARAFYSEQLEDFKAGRTDLGCTQCGAGFFMKQSELKRLAETGEWRTLQSKVIEGGYKLDLGYLYLGLAADGMGYKDASRAYFTKALELADTEDYSCAKGHMINCQGHDVKSEAEAKLR